jgi:arsenite methyltransferase
MKPDYGLDAPGVIRNLAIGGLAAVIVAVLALALPTAVLPMARADRTISSVWFFLTGFILLIESAWMLYSSKAGKLHMRERVIDALALQGGERVLDGGCGRGLLLVAAAKRLPRGEAVGIDLWSARDLSENRPEAALENARREGVENCVKVVTGDMTRMPFSDASFDAAVASLSIHNIRSHEGRMAAVKEIVRVLKPGGRVAIVDIARTGEYVGAFRQLGWTDIRRTGYSLRMFPPVRMVVGTKPVRSALEPSAGAVAKPAPGRAQNPVGESSRRWDYRCLKALSYSGKYR